MEELPDILLLGAILPNNSNRKSNSKPFLSSRLTCRVNQIYKQVCIKKHISCPTHRLTGGGKSKKKAKKSICFCKPIPGLFVNVSFHQKEI